MRVAVGATEWVLPALPTNKPQTPEQAESGRQRGRDLPPPEVLQPRTTWTKPADYDAQAAKLAKMFVDNFKNFEADVTPDVKAAGPKA